MVSVDVKPHVSFLQPTGAYGRAVPRCGVPVQHARDGVCACVQSVARPAADPARAAHKNFTSVASVSNTDQSAVKKADKIHNLP